MVLYFCSNVVSPPYRIYMGEDKYENEDLIKYGWPEDVWFHVDKLSSAHVYLRLRENDTIDGIPEAVLRDCAQLVKANSIQGNKENNLEVVYTMWSNLKKTSNMEVGQIGFHKNKEVKKIKVEKRINEIVNRLNKTLEELKPDLQKERDDRDRKEREAKKAKLKEEEKRKKDEDEEKKKQAELRSYDSFMKSENMTSNQDDGNDSDDFM